MRRDFLLTGLFGCLCACSAPAPVAPKLGPQTPLITAISISGEAQPTLSDRMNRYRVPAISLAIIEDGQMTDSSVVGLTLDNRADTIGPDTRFQAASIGKAVTAIGILRLVDQGQVDLDGSANRYLSRFVLRDADGIPADAVTLRQLLTHSAGVNIPSYPGFERHADLPDLLDILEGTPKAESAPVRATQSTGTYRYSGGGFSVLQAIIEDVSGETFEAFMQRDIFIPLGLSRTSFQIASSETGRARGHDWSGAQINGGWADYPQAAAAGLWTTSTDLARLLVSLSAAWRGDDQSLLSQDLARELATAQGGGMGLGFGLDGDGARLHVSHSGSSLGYNAYALLYPETGNGAVVMTNGEGGRYLYDDIIRTLERQLEWPHRLNSETFEPQPDEVDRISALAGTYRMAPAGFPVDIRCDPATFGCDLITPRGSHYLIRAISPTGFRLSETGDALTVSDEGVIHIWGMTGIPVPDP